MTPFHGTNMPPLILYYILISTYFITIYAGTIRTTTNNEYLGQTLNCTANEACYIYCENNQACESATIYCATNQLCEVTCKNGGACEKTIIHAEYASLFKLLDCATGQWTCVGMTLYLPPNYYGQIRAFLLGGDRGFSAGSGNANPLQFYALYGWKDVNITTSSSYSNANQVGIMHCAINYTMACDISNVAWECDQPNAACNDPPTISPTISPTIPTTYPSNNPSISPSTYPTHIPTTTMPTTLIPTTANPSTSIPTTHIPTIYVPIDIPTTSNPTTSIPTTYIPTTSTPTTSIPTVYPTTHTPTTYTPTNNPITFAPTYDGQTSIPTRAPTSIPSHSPTLNPTSSPIPTTATPTINPSTSQPITALILTTQFIPYMGLKYDNKKSGVDPLIGLIIGLVLLLICFLAVLFWFCRRSHRIQRNMNHKFTETQAEVQNLKKKEADHTAYNGEDNNKKPLRDGDNPTLQVTAILNNPSSRSTNTNSHSRSHSHSHSDSSSNATIELLEEEGDPNEITHLPVKQNVNMMVELTALKTRSIASTVVSPLSHLSGLSRLSGIPSVPGAKSDNNESVLSETIQVVTHMKSRHIPHKSTQQSLDLSNLRRPVTAPAPPWATQQISRSGTGHDMRGRALSNSEEWEQQMNALRNMISIQAQSRPGSANFAAVDEANKSKRSFFEHDANMPMSAPVMDHNVFFNNMMNTFNSTNPPTATGMMQQNKNIHNISNLNIAPPPHDNMLSMHHNHSNDDNVSNLSSALSYLSGVPSAIAVSNNLQPTTSVNFRSPQSKELSIIWNEENEKTVTQTDMNENKGSDSDTHSHSHSHSHTHTMSGTLPTQLTRKIPSVVTIGNKTERSSDSRSNSDSEMDSNSNDNDHDYSTSVTATMSIGSHSHNIADPNKSNKISSHFRIPSVITDKHYSDEEDSLNLPSLIRIDEGVQQQIQVQMDQQMQEQIDMLPEQDEHDDDYYNESEMTIELQLDDNEASDMLREETEEYTDDESDEEDTLLTKDTRKEHSNDTNDASDGSDASGFEEYGNDDNNSHSHSHSHTQSTDSNTHSNSDTHSGSDSETPTETYKDSIVINDDDLMDDDLDMLTLTKNDIEKSFNDEDYNDEYDHNEQTYDEDEYYDNDNDEYED